MAGRESAASIISLPKGGGALSGLGEKFSPDLHTGTGNFTIPISLPPGRNGFGPTLNLVYSTGNGNGYFGLGWSLSVPGVTRKTSKGIPRYRDMARELKDRDVFVLSGAEDLVELGPFTDEAGNEAVRYRPRTEGLFAEILRYRDASRRDYWRVRTKDGLVSYYGTNPDAGEHPQYPAGATAEREPATVARPDRPQDIFRWHLTLTKDPFGNRIEYLYESDSGSEAGRRWKQPLLKIIRYADYGSRANPSFLVTVTFDYEDRSDAFSEHRSGFEIRTSKRCKSVLIETHADADYKVRRYEFEYAESGANGLALLARVHVVGFDDAGNEARELPPLDFGYSVFRPDYPKRRDFYPLQGELPAGSLADPNLELVDLFGSGLPDILELNGVARYWRNLGNARFAAPRHMTEAPAGLALADADVQLLDADGDGRADLMVTQPALAGYFPLRFGARWDRRSLQRYAAVPSFSLEDPELRLLDLDGDGVTDAIRSGARLECFFNDAEKGWSGTRFVERRDLEGFPNINFSDPRVKWSDVTGDGMQDLVLVHDGNVEYWANCGHGDWAPRISMRNSPRFPFGYDARRILIGDVDGDGLADIVYVDDRKIRLWLNRSGNAWSAEIVIAGTPPLSNFDAVRLSDLLGSGVAGVLWSKDAAYASQDHYFFLDLTGASKPYLLNELNNNMGAVTKVGYAPSTRFYLEDEKRRETRWKTPLPVSVQVVAEVEVIDELAQGKLTTEYRYHHGYRDGLEGEFRGFGMVEQFDSESFEKYASAGLHGRAPALSDLDREYFSPPTMTRTWFHQGAVEDEEGDWGEAFPSDEYWEGDPHLLGHPAGVAASLLELARTYAHLPSRERRRITRDALRTLRGSVLRTELYALDGSARERRPYTVTETAYDVREELPRSSGNEERRCIFFPHVKAQRTTQWERGDDPLTRFTFNGDYDGFGQPISQSVLAMPRRSARRIALPGGGVADETRVLATHGRKRYAVPQQGFHVHDRVAAETSFALRNAPAVAETAPNDVRGVLRDQYRAAATLHLGFETTLATWAPSDGAPAAYRIFAHTVHRYDGLAFTGLAPGNAGRYGALSQTEDLVLTEEILGAAYGTTASLVTAQGRLARTNGVPTTFDDQLGYTRRMGHDHVDGLYFSAASRQTDFQATGTTIGRGLVVATRDPMGRQTDIDFDPYDHLPKTVTDPLGLVMSAAYNYRTLRPTLITDVNDNRVRVDYSPLGLVSAVWIMGKANRTEGDRTRPSARVDYDLRAFFVSKIVSPATPQPVYAHTVRDVHFETDLANTGTTIETREYSDGFGRLMQVRTQSDELIFGDADFGGGDSILPEAQSDPGRQTISGQRNSDTQNPNVVVSGWQRYDNKGRIVEKHEPLFAKGWAFRAPAAGKMGQKARNFYDPRGQLARTVQPDGSERRIVYGIPGTLDDPARDDAFVATPWEAFTYDENDNAGRTHPNSSVSYRHHWNTPTNVVIDALGRTTMTVARTRPAPASTTDPLAAVQSLQVRTTYDIQGNRLSVRDPLGREVFGTGYDLAKRPLKIECIDAGRRWLVYDAVGSEIERRDGKGALTLRSYDALNRLTALRARDAQGLPLSLREQLAYGDGSDRNQSLAARDANRDKNRLGALYQHYDEAGLLTCEAYDFAGNLIEHQRKVFSDQTVLGALSAVPGRPLQTFTVDWAGNPALDNANPFDVSRTFDAMQRITQTTCPRDVRGQRSTLTAQYSSVGMLKSIALDGVPYVSHIANNAKRQRVLIAYGNQVMTRYAYDDRTFRLARLRTDRFTQPNAESYRRQGSPLQDCVYDYDLSGNVIQTREQVGGCGVQGSLDGADVLLRSFEYDPQYRLTRATGRESDNIAAPRPWDDLARGGFDSSTHGTPTQDSAPTQTRLYWEAYAYDPAGNLLSMTHGDGAAGPVSWVRRFGMGGFTPQEWRTKITQLLGGATPSWGAEGNRVTNAGSDNQSTTHRYDQNGNLIQELTNRHFAWDHSDRLIAFADRPTGAAAATKEAVYLYDSAGQRIKKLVRWSATTFETTVYVDGLFEYHRRSTPGAVIQNNALQVMDDQRRIGLVRIGTAFPTDGGPAVAYHLSDHIKSSSVVIGGNTNTARTFVNREEYFPYGECSFGSFGRKRYRFTGRERDEETGLSYHSARYLAPWLARWCSADPGMIADGLNLYRYASSNPIIVVDPTGWQGEKLDFEAHQARMEEIKREFNSTVAKTLPAEKTPTTGREKSKAVDIVSEEHDKAVVEIVNAAITASEKRAQELGRPVSQYKLLHDALFEYVTKYRNQTADTSQNLVLRDVDHYLVGRLQQWRQELPWNNDPSDPPPGPTTSGLVVTLGEFAAGIYDERKRESFAAAPDPDAPNARSSEDAGKSIPGSRPASAPGGRFWARLGGQHLLTRDKPEQPGKASDLHITYEDVKIVRDRDARWNSEAERERRALLTEARLRKI
jgi:RHS repeat-associated protein